MTTSTDIQREIESTRADIRRTMAALEHRLSSGALIQRFITPAKDGTLEFGRAFGNAVRANPLALGVTVVGLGWLMLAAPRGGDGNGRAIADRRAAPGRRLDPNRTAQFVTDAQGNTYRPGLHDAAGAAAPVAPAADETRQSIGDKVAAARQAVSETASEAASTAREAIAAARSWTAETASEAAEVAKRRTTSTYQATRAATGQVRGRLRAGASQASGYAREHPLAVGAAVVLGGAALALLLARRTRSGHDEPADAAAGMPETPYASGQQAAADDGQHRNPTTPLTPDEEETVFAEGNRSAAATPPLGSNGDGQDPPRPAGAAVSSSEAPASIAVGAMPTAAPAGAEPRADEQDAPPAASPPRAGSSFGTTMDSNPDAIGRQA